MNIQGVSETGGQTLRAYSTCCKDGKKSYKHGSGNASFTSYKHFLLMESAEKLNVSIKKSFLKGDALVKIPLVWSVTGLGKQDLSYWIQLIEDKTET